MAAKHTTGADSSLAVGLTRVEPALAAWRRQRRHREAIPDSLWRLIVPLAQAHGVSRVAQALRLNYTALKQRSVAASGTSAVGKPLGGFIEVPMVGAPSATPWVIEMDDGRGTKLTVRLAQGQSAAVLTLAQGLWRQRA